MQIVSFYEADMQIYEVEKFVKVSHHRVGFWSQNLREICAKNLQRNPISLGNSENSIFEIDELLFGKTHKYH